MKCQKCVKKHANVSMHMQYNNEKINVQLCNSCFQEMQGQMLGGNDFFKNNDMFSNHFNQQSFGGQGQGQSRTRTKEKQAGNGNGLLDELGTNVTDQARNGKIDPVIGRDNEVKRVVETLNRRNKNYPVLSGEPGVGKTAMAEGLALKIVEGDVTAKILDKEIYILDVASFV